jgi:L-fuconate dehydratase
MICSWNPYVDHLHEQFEDPVVIERGRYRAPTRPGMARMRDDAIAGYRFPSGPAWADAAPPMAAATR